MLWLLLYYKITKIQYFGSVKLRLIKGMFTNFGECPCYFIGYKKLPLINKLVRPQNKHFLPFILL